MIDLIVIGAGVSGLSIAREAKARHIHTVVLEASNGVGGVLASTIMHGVPLDHAAQSVAWTEDLASKLHSWNLEIVPIKADAIARVRCIFRHGRVHRLTASPLTLLSTRLVSVRGKLRLLQDLASTRNTLAPSASLADSISARFGAEIMSAVVAPIVKGMYGCHPSQLDVDAAWPNARRYIKTHGSLLRGMIANRSKRATRSIVTFDGGMASLMKAISVGLDVRTGSSVVSIARNGDNWSVAYRCANGIEEIIHAHNVVSTIPAANLSHVVSSMSTSISQIVRDMPSSAISVHHALFAPDVEVAKLDAFGVLLADNEHDALLGILDHGSTFPDLHNGLRHLVFFVEGTAQERIDNAVEFGMAMLSIQTAPIATHTVRCASAIPVLALGHLERIRSVYEFECENPGLFLTGSWRHGVGIPSCILASNEIVDRLRP